MCTLRRVCFVVFMAVGLGGRVESGVVVVEVKPGGAASVAGLRAGDLLESWERSGYGGPLASPFHAHIAETEQAPLSRVTIAGMREGHPFSTEIPPGRWQVELRPLMAGDLLSAYGEAADLEKEGDHAGAAASVERLAGEGGADPTRSAWLLLRAAEWISSAGNWERSVALVERGAGLMPALEPGLQAALWQIFGNTCLTANRFDDAALAYGRAHEQRRSIARESPGVAASLLSLGDTAYERKDLDAARGLFEQSIAMFERLAPGSLELARALNYLGGSYARRGTEPDADRAEVLHQRALAIQQAAAPLSLELSVSYSRLGFVAYTRRDTEAMSRWWDAALDVVARLNPDTLDHAVALETAGLAAQMHDDLAAAEIRYLQSTAIRRRQAPDSDSLARNFNRLGGLALRRGNLVSADEYFHRALDLRSRLSPSSLEVALVLTQLGFAAAMRGEMDQATRYAQRALEIEEKLAPESGQIVDTLRTLGYYAVARRSLDEAERYLERALALHEGVPLGSHQTPYILNGIGDLNAARGDLVAAESAYRRAVDIQSSAAPTIIAGEWFLLDLARVLERKGDHQEAEVFTRRALALAESISPGSALVAQASATLGRLLDAGGKAGEALGHFVRAIEALESQVGKLGGVEETRTAYRASYISIYRETIDLLARVDRDEEAFGILERSRARGFLSLLAERDLVFSADLPADLDRRRRVVAARYDEAQEQLRSERDLANIRELTENLASLRRQRQEIGETIRASAPRLAALQNPVPLDAAGARAALDPGTLVLSYAVSGEQTHLFIAGRDAGLQREMIRVSEADLRTQVRRFREAIAISRDVPSAYEMTRQGRELYRMLVAPAESRIASASRILIVPDGPLHFLPFAALVRTGAGYLIEWKPIHLAASLTTYAEIRRAPARRRETAAPAVLAFGDPRYPASSSGELVGGDPVLRGIMSQWGSLRPLPGTREEVRAIAALFEGRSTAFLGEEATERRAREAGIAPAIIHFAAHGLLNERSPLDSAIALSIPERFEAGLDNGLLQVWEILESLRIDADLVTLSACETALGQELAGEGVIGLTRAFHYAGARTVLASLWSVADRSTADLMKRFYGYLRGGMSKDEALRAAQIDLIHGVDRSAEPDDEQRGVKKLSGQKEVDPRRHASPYFWAAFTLYGNWR